MTFWTSEDLYASLKVLRLAYTHWDYENVLVDGGYESSCLVWQDDEYKSMKARLLSRELAEGIQDPNPIVSLSEITPDADITPITVAELLKKAGFREDWLPPKRPLPAS